jgi:hypothetical protein
MQAMITRTSLILLRIFITLQNTYMCIRNDGKTLWSSEKALQAGRHSLLEQGHPPEYPSKEGNIVFYTVQNSLQFWNFYTMQNNCKDLCT